MVNIYHYKIDPSIATACGYPWPVLFTPTTKKWYPAYRGGLLCLGLHRWIIKW